MKIREKGPHTWNLHVHYHRCPSCGYIIESRDDFHYRQGKYFKELDCSRCHHHFVASKPCKVFFGPFFGNETKPEFDWS